MKLFFLFATIFYLTQVNASQDHLKPLTLGERLTLDPKKPNDLKKLSDDAIRRGTLTKEDILKAVAQSFKSKNEKNLNH